MPSKRPPKPPQTEVTAGQEKQPTSNIENVTVQEIFTNSKKLFGRLTIGKVKLTAILIATVASSIFGAGVGFNKWFEKSQLDDAKEALRQSKSEVETLTKQLEKSVATIEGMKNRNRNANSLGSGTEALSEFLALYDPAIFYGSRTGKYDVARILPDQAALHRDSSLSIDLAGTKRKFDMLANTANWVVQIYKDEILNMLERGVDIRIILSDYRKENANFDAFSLAVGEASADEPRGGAKNVHDSLNKMIKLAESNPRHYKGKLEVRWNQAPLLYTMWLRDRNSPDTIAHLGVHLYSGKTVWPSFRISKDGAAIIKNLEMEFDKTWEASLPFEAIPLPDTPPT